MKTKFLVLEDVILNTASIKKVVKHTNPAYGDNKESYNINITYDEINYKGELTATSHYVTFDKKNKCDDYYNDIAKQIVEVDKN